MVYLVRQHDVMAEELSYKRSLLKGKLQTLIFTVRKCCATDKES